MRAARPRVAITLAMFAAAFLALAVGSYTQTSATWDEPQHLTGGYLALTRGDYRLDPEHPPLVRLFAALPLLGQAVVETTAIDRTRPIEWVAAGQLRFAHRFLYRDNDADRLLYRARFMVALLGVLLGVFVFGWAYEWLGYWPAVMALVFYTLEPNMLAHASLVTSDFGVTSFLFGAVYALWRAWRAPSGRNLAFLTVCTVCAVLSKFSGLILLPVIAVLLAIAVIHRRGLMPRHAAIVAAMLAVSMPAAVWAAYGFRHAPDPSGTWRFAFQHDPGVTERMPATTRLVAWVDEHALVPNAFAQGFLLGQARAQERPSYLAGGFSTRGWWFYFPIAFLLKTPLSLLVLLLMGVVLVAARRYALGDSAFVWLPVVIYGAWAMTMPLNIGLRHLLPIYPFVVLLAAAAAKTLLAGRGTGRLVLGALALFWVFEFTRAYPHTLSFFNQLAGGPAGGHAYLVDSNLDWGQDLKGLKAWMDDHNVPSINLAYFGTADPAYYGIDATYLPAGYMFSSVGAAAPKLPGYVAISETTLKGVYLDEQVRRFYAPLERIAPVTTIGHSIRVYRVEQRWW
jgi:hypothetical protein